VHARATESTIVTCFCWVHARSLQRDDRLGTIQHVAMAAGSAVFFNGGATAHGAYGWMGEGGGRRAVIVNYISKHVEYPRF